MRDPLAVVFLKNFQWFEFRMISAFQNCSKFEDQKTFGKTHYPKENINMLSHSVSDKVLENQKWTTLAKNLAETVEFGYV